MKHSLAGQIQMIQHARTTIQMFENLPSALRVSLDEGLNDAASTIAALNLNPDIFQRVKELEEALLIYINAEKRSPLETSILTHQEQHRINIISMELLNRQP